MPFPVTRSWLRQHYLAVLSGALVFVLVVTVLLGSLREILVIRHKNNQTLTSTRIDLDYATYQGTRLSNGINQFLGMRYAAAPVGDLRWRKPQDPPAEDVIQDATDWKPICLATNAGENPGGQDEDCLFVNVWAPSNATSQSKLPVWLFIQGGGYVSNSNSNWNGSEVVETSGNNIVFVNFNYRVGLWGFLAGEKVASQGDLNAGLLDQRQLLHWVQKYISRFGGDPDHVVIHGISAGAGSVALHLAAYGGRDDGLFAGAILQSAFFPAQPRVQELEYQFNRTIDLAGCTAATDAMACLRSKDTATLQNVNTPAPFPGRNGWPLFYWTPCIDGDLIRDVPYAMYDRRAFVRVPVILGTANDEGSVFAGNVNTQSDFVSWITDQYPLLSEQDAQTMVGHYPMMVPLPRHNRWFPSASMAYGEATFICPSNYILDIFAQEGLGDQSWSWRYNVWDQDNFENGFGVPHVFDAPAVFGPHNLPSPGSYFTYNQPVVPIMMNYMISFVRTLDPNIHRFPAAPFWDTWGCNSAQRRIVVETGKSRMEKVNAGQNTRCLFWKDVGIALEQRR